MKKSLLILVFTFFIFKSSFGQSGAPTAAPEIRSFSLQPDEMGSATNSVNLFTGQVSLPVNLLSLESHNGLDFSLAIGYSSNVQNNVTTWNRESPAGILGLGWTLDVPKIVANTKQTGAREDDDYFLLEGGTSNHLIRINSGYDPQGSYYEYSIKNYKFWKIKYYYDIFEINGTTGYGTGPNRWEIIKEDGTKYVYGDNNSNRGTIQYAVRWANWIGPSSKTTGQSQLAVAWNLSEVVNQWNERLTYEYLNVEQPVGAAAGMKHTEASYLKQITDIFGRKVQFAYKEKESQYYSEPHIEKPEPDAYQEVYERKYLDRIDVLSETATLIFSLNFRYTALNPGTSTAKMQLVNIFQKNANGETLPGYQFVYNTSGPTTGYLYSVKYPTGRTVTYTYTPSVIKHSNLDISISAPGYWEPQVFLHDDYALVAWRSMGAGSTHDKGPQNVQLYVYHWVGEWKSQFLQTISGVNLTDTDVPDANMEYYSFKDFQVVTEDDFFGVLSHGASNNYSLFVGYVDEANRGQWGTYTTTHNYGPGLPTLLSGDKFIAVGSSQDGGTPPNYETSYIYTFLGDSWRETVLNQTDGEHFYTSANNYFISHNRSRQEFNFYYMKEDRTWVTKTWNTWLQFSSSDKSFWHATNSYAVAMAANNPEFIYRWDLTYTNFFRDDVLPAYGDDSFVFNIDNNLIGIVPRIPNACNGIGARYDGTGWNLSSTVSAYYQSTVSWGPDYAIWDVDDRTRPVSAYQRKYDPNTSLWSDVDMTFSPNSSLFDDGWNPLKAASNYFCFLDKIYLRKPDGTWSPDLSFPIAAGNKINADVVTVGSDKYFVFTTDNVQQNPIARTVQFLQNGALGASASIGKYCYWDRYGFQYVMMADPGMVVTYPSSYVKDATSLTLYHVSDNQAISGKKTVYPVTMLQESDGFTVRNTAIGYNLTTATVDPLWTTAMFNEVDVVPGSSVTTDHTNGYVKNFFINGLTATDEGTINTTEDSRYLIGSNYEVRNYNANNSYATTINTYNVFSQTINDGGGLKVETGFYPRLTNTLSKTDGQQTNTSFSYSTSTGLVVQKTLSYIGSSNDTEQVQYKYVADLDNVAKQRNILTPVCQTLTYANSNIVESQVTRWKYWTVSGNSNGALMPFDTYDWKRSNSTDFSTWWDVSTTPSSDWLFSSGISARDQTTGMPLEQVTGGGQVACQVWDNLHKNIIVQLANGSYSTTGYTSFEDGATGTFSVNDGTIIAGASKTGKKYLNLGTLGITKVGLNPNEKYVVSFWAISAGGSVTIDGVGVVNIGNTGGWKLIQSIVTNVSSVTVKLNGATAVSIDEVRLYPSRALINTYTFDPLFGVSSETDTNNHSQYVEYDNWGRVLQILDENKNIVKLYSYNIKR